MAIFSAIGAAVASIFGGIFSAGAFSTFLVKTLARVAVSFLLKALTKKEPDQAFGVSGKLQVGEETPRGAPMGIGFTEGSLVYTSYWGNADVPNAYLTQVIALSDLPVKGIAAILVDGSYCTPFDPAPVVTLPAPRNPWPEDNIMHRMWEQNQKLKNAALEEGALGMPLAEFRKNGQNYAWVKFYDGTQTTADPLLVGSAQHPEHPWGANFIGTGVAYVVCTTRLNTELFSGFPRFGFVLDSVPLYDPSRDSTVGGDGDHRADLPSTWGGSGDYLPAVQAYNVMRGLRYNEQWIYGFQGVGASRLPPSDWIREINKCRVLVPTSFGPRESYRASGMMNFGAECGQALESIMAAAAGRIAEVGGVYKPLVGGPNAPVAHIDEDDIVATEGHAFSPMKRLADRVNAVEAQYPAPEEGFSLKAATPLYNDALQAVDGGRRLTNQITLYNVPYADQVDRLMHLAVQEARKERRHIFVLPPRYYRLEPLDTVTFTSVQRGYDGKIFRVESAVLRADCHLMVELVEVDEADYDFDGFVGYTPPEITPVLPPSLERSYLVSVVGTALEGMDADGIVRRAGIRIEWDYDQAASFSGVTVQVRLSVIGSPTRTITRIGTDGAFDIFEGLIPATGYEFRAAPITNGPVGFSAWQSVTTVGAPLLGSDLDQSIWDAIDEAANEAAALFGITPVFALPTSAEEDQIFLKKPEMVFYRWTGEGWSDEVYAAIAAGSVVASKIAAGAVTAAKIAVADLSAISANLGTIMVGTANIADAAIATAKIGDLQVDTLKIAGNAVSIFRSVSGSGTGEICSLTFTPHDPGVPLAIWISGIATSNYTDEGSGSVTVTIRWRGVIVATMSGGGPPGYISLADNRIVAGGSGPGTLTVTVTGTIYGGGGIGAGFGANVVVICAEVKK